MAKRSEAVILDLRRLCLLSPTTVPRSLDEHSLHLWSQSLLPVNHHAPQKLLSTFLSSYCFGSEISSKPRLHSFSSKPIFSRGHNHHGLHSKIYSSEICSSIFPIGLCPSNCLFSRGIIPKFSSNSGLPGVRIKVFPRSAKLSKRDGYPFGSRFFSFKSSHVSSSDSGLQKVLKKPILAVNTSLQRYREAIGLHIEALWKRYSLLLVGATGLAFCILLWRIMFGIANTFVGLSEGMAKYGFLALAMAIVTFLGFLMKLRFTINPDKVYRLALRKLNTSAGILEVMGAPLSGTDLRAYVMSGGGIHFKNFKLRFGRKRCFLIFPIQGSERKGLVTVEVKKKKGQYDVKLLSVDIPVASGPDQRLFLIGDEQEYQIGGGLISELRDPIVKAIAAEKEFDALDQKEEEEDKQRELHESERKQREELDKLPQRDK